MAKVFTKEEIKFIKDYIEFNGYEVDDIKGIKIIFTYCDPKVMEINFSDGRCFHIYVSMFFHFKNLYAGQVYTKEDLEKPIDD